MKIKVHTSFIGKTGYNAHSRDFFTELSKLVKLKIRNFTVGNSWKGLTDDPHAGEDYISEYQKRLIGEQTAINNKGEYFDTEIYDGLSDIENYDIDLVLNETNHRYFYDFSKFKGKFKIAYNVWESTRQPQNYFDKLLLFDQLWVPTEWQKKVSIEQGFPEDRVFVVPEAVDSSIFFPDDNKTILNEYKDNRFKFLIFGRWDGRKSTKELIETFLRTFKKTEPVDLIISVENPYSVDGLKTTEERLKQNGLLDPRIKILNFPSREDYINYLKNGHVFLSCARSEGWNLPLCLPEGKLILSNKEFKNIEDIKVNDFVFSHTGKEQKVLNTFKNPYNGNLINIKLFGDIENLELTPEHPVYCIKRELFITKKNKFKNIINLKPEWIKSKYIKKGDIIIRTNINQQCFNKKEIFDMLSLDNNLMYDDKSVWYKTGYSTSGKLIKYNRFVDIFNLSYLFGWYIAEGTDGDSKLIFSLNSTSEIHIAKKIISEINKHFNAIGNYTINDNKLRVTFNSKILCKFFTFFCNKLAWNKIIPKEMLLGDLNILQNLINNMTLGDGHFDKNKNLTSYTTTSYILARQIILANQRLNIKTNLQLNKRKRIDKRKCYTLTWSLDNNNFRHSNKSWWHPNGLAILVKDVNIKKYDGYVYNIEVENDNSYLMANATVHNCEALACGTPSIYSNWGAQLHFASGKGHPVRILGEMPADKSGTATSLFSEMPGNYCEPDFNDLSRVMRDVYVNYWEYKRKAIQDSKLVRNEFSWKNAAVKAKNILENVYSNLHKTQLEKSSDVVFFTGGDKKYLPVVEKFVKSLQLYSNIPIIVYGFNCDINFDYPNIIKRRINVERQRTCNDRDTRPYYYKIDASLDCLEKDDSKIYIWIDGDCVANYNIDALVKYKDNIDNYPLCMRYQHENLIHYRHNKNKGHGEELGDYLKIKRNNNFTIATGLYMFDKRSKPFFEEVLKYHEYFLQNINSNFYVDDMAFSEERLFNVLFWKYEYKKHLPITWVSNTYLNNNSNSIYSHKINGYVKNGFDIMFDYDGTNPLENTLENQSKILFYHGQRDIEKVDELINKLEVNKLMIVAHPDDETIFAGGMLLKENGWKVVVVTDGGGDNNDSEERKQEFINVMNHLNIKEYEILGFKDDMNNVLYDENEVENKLRKIIDSKKWSKIITHNKDGEYGHIVHKSVHNIVKKIVPTASVFSLSNDKLDDKTFELKINILSLYKSQNTNLPGFERYLTNEGLIDFYEM